MQLHSAGARDEGEDCEVQEGRRRRRMLRRRRRKRERRCT